MKTQSVSGRPTAVLRYRHLETPPVPIMVTEHGVEFEIVGFDGCEVVMGMDMFLEPQLQMTIQTDSSQWENAGPGHYLVSAPLCKGRNTEVKAALMGGCVVAFLVLVVVLCLL